MQLCISIVPTCLKNKNISVVVTFSQITQNYMLINTIRRKSIKREIQVTRNTFFTLKRNSTVLY